MGTATRDDVWLCLHLYEQRREAGLREAREWVMNFQPKSLKDVMDVIEGKAGEDANRLWRQGTSYWEMITTLMMSTGISTECRELFAGTTREYFLLYAKLHPFLDDLRKATRPTAFRNIEAFCRALPDHDAALAYFTKMNEKIRARMKAARRRNRK